MKLVSSGATVTVLCLWGAIGLLASPLSAGDSGQKKPPAEQAYTITQLDTGANVASSAQLISDNGVVAGNLQEGSRFSFVWSAQTGFVVLTLGGTQSLVTGVSVNGIVTGAADTPGGEVLGVIWTPAEGLVTIGDLGGGLTIPQGVTSSGLVIGDSSIPGGPEHAFMWTRAGGIVDLDPTGLIDSTGRFATEDGSLIIGSIFAETGWRIFAWTETTGLTDIGSLGRDMLPEYMNRQGALTGTVLRMDDTGDFTEGTFFWSPENGLEDIGSLGGDEIRPTAINDAGTIVGFGTTASGETHGFVWSKANGLVDIGTLGSDFSLGLSPQLIGAGHRLQQDPERRRARDRVDGRRWRDRPGNPRRKKQQGRFRH